MKFLHSGFVIFMLFCFNANICFSQNNVAYKRICIGATISDFAWENPWHSSSSNSGNTNIMGGFIDYKLRPFVSAGIYGGYNSVMQTTSLFITTQETAVHFGVHYKVHIIQLFVPDKVSRLDLYTKAKMGKMVIKKSDAIWAMPSGTSNDCGVYAGLGFYLFGNFGAFAELGYGMFSEKTFGIVQRF